MKNERTRKPEIEILTDFFGKVPPQAADMEEAVLGAMMVDNECIDTCLTLLTEDMFYSEANRNVFLALKNQFSKGEPIDISTVALKLKNDGKIEASGGFYYLSQLAAKVGSGAHAEYHAKIILQKYLSRKLIEAGNEIVKLGYDEKTDIQDILSAAEKEINGVIDIAAGRQEVKSISTIMDEVVDTAYRKVRAARDGNPTGILTGLSDLDKATAGWQKSNLIVLAGRPGMGKTAALLHFAKTAARNGIPVLIFSLEMSAAQLGERLVVSFCDIEAYKFRNSWLSNDELRGIESAAEQIKTLPITIDDAGTVNMSYIRAKSRALHKQGKCEMVFIDHLQLISEDAGYGRNRDNVVAEISRNAKILAKELNIPVMLLSQLNREVEKRADKRPQLSDLRESGAIEQDADIVIFIYRPSYYKIETELGSDTGEFIIAKFREGALSGVKFKYNGSLTKIFDYDIPVSVPEAQKETKFTEIQQVTDTELPF
jgi:replicative DNA helicase